MKLSVSFSKYMFGAVTVVRIGDTRAVMILFGVVEYGRIGSVSFADLFGVRIFKRAGNAISILGLALKVK